MLCIVVSWYLPVVVDVRCALLFAVVLWCDSLLVFAVVDVGVFLFRCRCVLLRVVVCRWVRLRVIVRDVK